MYLVLANNNCYLYIYMLTVCFHKNGIVEVFDRNGFRGWGRTPPPPIRGQI